MTPAKLTLPLPAAYIGASWSLVVQVFDENASGVAEPADLTGAAANLYMTTPGLAAASRILSGVIEAAGIIRFSPSADLTTTWPAASYDVELTLDQDGGNPQSILVGTVPVVAGPHARQDAAYSSPLKLIGGTSSGTIGLVRAETGRIHIVRVDRVVIGGGGSAATTTFDDALTMLGVGNVQDAIVALYALIGGGPAPDPGGQLDFSNPINSALIGAL